ncbi:Hsp33 family molecular chaperone HslO [Clostridium tarantellae]|uniref:33 kDa chaperonin n=1 Tax=Clostridium tarantellae TaxID=39493 RepID=A0A6I1MIX3_9CLOT|nr:Hsp33 family molecular chaperone HslO [Clostridium tarantellae]MPQ42643.1 Hsp33 family molecular chaperone HslO [Clostridium tarantellae]
MKDKLIRATAKNGMVRIFAAQTTELVNEAAKIHNCTPTASAALGRMLTAGTMMGAMLKSDKEVLTIQINGGGPAKGVTVTAYSDCSVKGYIGNPEVDLPLNSENGKLNVGEAIGKNGILTVIKDLGLKDPYVGQVPIFSGEIAEDFAYYFTVSEQIPSAVALGVLVDKDLSIKAAGGFIVQLMPGCDELLGDLITYRLEEIPTVTTMLSEGKDIKEIIEFIFEGMDLKINEEEVPKYNCNCSREKVERALASIGYKDLKELKDEGKTEELKCHFCNKAYEFNSDDIGNLLETYKK